MPYALVFLRTYSRCSNNPAIYPAIGIRGSVGRWQGGWQNTSKVKSHLSVLHSPKSAGELSVYFFRR
jgi:hypothetical protein